MNICLVVKTTKTGEYLSASPFTSIKAALAINLRQGSYHAALKDIKGTGSYIINTSDYVATLYRMRVIKAKYKKNDV